MDKQKIKEHWDRNKKTYLACGITAGITTIIMRGIAPQPITCTIGAGAGRTIGAVGKKVVMSNVSMISADRQGPPSWVVRCKETGDIFTSQRSAALEMGLPADHLSNHLNGFRDHVNNLHFERICIAA